MSTVEEAAFVESSGNVFADLGLPNPDERLIKAKLAHAISTIISERRLTQAQAASLLGTDQAKVSSLINGRLAGFSIERLFRFLVALDRDVTISVHLRPTDRPGRLELVEVG